MYRENILYSYHSSAESVYMDSDSCEENYYSDGDETVDDQSDQSEV